MSDLRFHWTCPGMVPARHALYPPEEGDRLAHRERRAREDVALAGRPAPAGLERAIEEAGGYAPELGVEHTTELARELLAGGAPSIHLYTFNRHERVLGVLRELELLTPDPVR